MPRHQRLSVGVFLVSGLLSLEARAQDTDCLGNLGAVEVRGDLNIAVSCRLTGTVVTGKVTLFAGGALVARDARINGSVEGKRADFVDIDRSTIGGSLRLEEFVGDSSTIQRTNVGGNTELSDNRSRLEILNNDFGRRVELSKNRGGVLISGNSIDGDLRCNGNNPEPTGLGNEVDGDVRGQCEDLQPDTTSPPPAMPPPTTSQPPPTTSRPPPTTSQPPPTTSQPPPTTSQPPPTTSQPPPTTSQPPPTTSSPPSGSSPPPATTPTTTSTPPAAAPPATATPPTAADTLVDEGGAGAFGWPGLFLLSLLAWRRFAERRVSDS